MSICAAPWIGLEEVSRAALGCEHLRYPEQVGDRRVVALEKAVVDLAVDEGVQ